MIAVSGPIPGTPRIPGIFDGVVGWNLEESGWWFSALNIRQRVSGLAHARVVAFGKNRYLQIGRIPSFSCGHDGLRVAHGPSRDGMGYPFTLCIHTANSLRA
jgi:hypothetical protein